METKLNIASDDRIPKQNEWAESKVVFYWDQPFQPKPVLVETVEVSNKTLFQPFLVDTRLWLGIVICQTSSTFSAKVGKMAEAQLVALVVLQELLEELVTHCYTLWIGWWIGIYSNIVTGNGEDTCHSNYRLFWECRPYSFSDSKLKNFRMRRNTFLADSLRVIACKL